MVRGKVSSAKKFDSGLDDWAIHGIETGLNLIYG
jgi:hypothetical protein